MGRKRFKKRKAVDNAFFNAWHCLASAGGCDAFGSVQCDRIYLEWLQAGSPRPVTEFIRVKANEPSNSVSALALEQSRPNS